MAEVIALVASIVSILEGVHETASFVRKRVHSTKSLREEIVPLLSKLTALKGILQGLQLQCELSEPDHDRLHVLSHLNDPLKACDLAIRTVMARLDRVRSTNPALLTFGKFLDNETLTALRLLDNARSVLDLALSADQM